MVLADIRQLQEFGERPHHPDSGYERALLSRARVAIDERRAHSDIECAPDVRLQVIANHEAFVRAYPEASARLEEDLRLGLAMSDLERVDAMFEIGTEAAVAEDAALGESPQVGDHPQPIALAPETLQGLVDVLVLREVQDLARQNRLEALESRCRRGIAKHRRDLAQE